MSMIYRLLRSKISSDAFDHYLTERASYVAAVVMLAFGIPGLEKFDLSGGDFFLGILGVLGISLLFVVLGRTYAPRPAREINR